jgi:hypothetical protein
MREAGIGLGLVPGHLRCVARCCRARTPADRQTPPLIVEGRDAVEQFRPGQFIRQTGVKESPRRNPASRADATPPRDVDEWCCDAT